MSPTLRCGSLSFSLVYSFVWLPCNWFGYCYGYVERELFAYGFSSCLACCSLIRVSIDRIWYTKTQFYFLSSISVFSSHSFRVLLHGLDFPLARVWKIGVLFLGAKQLVCGSSVYLVFWFGFWGFKLMISKLVLSFWVCQSDLVLPCVWTCCWCVLCCALRFVSKTCLCEWLAVICYFLFTFLFRLPWFFSSIFCAPCPWVECKTHVISLSLVSEIESWQIMRTMRM